MTKGQRYEKALRLIGEYAICTSVGKDVQIEAIRNCARLALGWEPIVDPPVTGRGNIRPYLSNPAYYAKGKKQQ